MTNHWIDIKNADCILIMGSNAAANHPISFKWVYRAKENGALLISVDPGDLVAQHPFRRLESNLILTLDEQALYGDFARNVLRKDTGRIRGLRLFRNDGHLHILARALDGLGRAVPSDSAPKDQNLLFHGANPHARARRLSTTVSGSSCWIDLFLLARKPIANFRGWASLSARRNLQRALPKGPNAERVSRIEGKVHPRLCRCRFLGRHTRKQ